MASLRQDVAFSSNELNSTKTRSTLLKRVAWSSSKLWLMQKSHGYRDAQVVVRPLQQESHMGGVDEAIFAKQHSISVALGFEHKAAELREEPTKSLTPVVRASPTAAP